MKKKILLSVLAVLLSVPMFIGAETSEKPEVKPEPKVETGTLKIAYFDDSDKKIPVEGSTWTLFKIGDVVTVPGENLMDGLHIESLIPEFEITRKTKVEDVMKEMVHEFNNESSIKMDGLLVKNKEKLDSFKGTTDKKGEILFKDLPYGIYLGVETQAARYHLVSEPFLLSLPNTDEKGLVSSIDLNVEPKAIIGGDLKISKVLNGNRTDKYTDWEMKVNLPEGKYRYETTAGKKGVIKNDEVVAIKGGESVTIFDVLSGKDYKVTELQANQHGYGTNYRNEKNTIKFKDVQEVIVTNTRNWEYTPIDTGDLMEELSSGNPMAWMTIVVPVTAIAGLLIIIYRKRKKDDK